MGGALTHIGIGIIGFLISRYYFKDSKKGVAFFIGSISPDLVNYGLITLLVGNFSYYGHHRHPLFNFLSWLGHNPFAWIFLCLILILITYLVYKLKYIDIKKFKYISILIAVFLVAVFIHLIIDITVDELYYWL